MTGDASTGVDIPRAVDGEVEAATSPAVQRSSTDARLDEAGVASEDLAATGDELGVAPWLAASRRWRTMLDPCRRVRLLAGSLFESVIAGGTVYERVGFGSGLGAAFAGSSVSAEGGPVTDVVLEVPAVDAGAAVGREAEVSANEGDVAGPAVFEAAPIGLKASALACLEVDGLETSSEALGEMVRSPLDRLREAKGRW